MGWKVHYMKLPSLAHPPFLLATRFTNRYLNMAWHNIIILQQVSIGSFLYFRIP